MENDNATVDEILEENFYEWKIEDWNKLENKKEYSSEFEIGGSKWYSIIYIK